MIRESDYELPKGIHLRGLKYKIEFITAGNVTVELTTGTLTEKDRVGVKSWVVFVLTEVGKLRPHPVRRAKVAVFLTRFKKLKPFTQSPLGEFEVNSGYCYSFQQIVIYRKEDWRKVFIHESYHLFGLDELAKGDLSSLFPIPTKISLKEVFSETNARILYCKWLNLPLEKEIDFSCAQMVKVLRHYGLTYRDVVMRTNLKRFVERSNVFAYYIVPAILLNDVGNFKTAAAAILSGEDVDLVSVIRSALMKMPARRAEAKEHTASLKMVGGKYVQKHKWKRSSTATKSSYTKRRSRR